MNTTTTIPVSSKCGKKRQDIPSVCFSVSRDASVSLLNHKAVSEQHPELVPKWREAEKLILSWRNGAAISARPAFDKKNAGWKPDISATSKWEVGGELASYILAMRKRRDAEILACSCGEAIRLLEIQGKDAAFLSVLFGMKGSAKEGVPHPTAEDFASILIGLPEISVKDCATRYRPQWSMSTGWTLKPVDVKTLPKMEPTRPLRKEGRGKVEEAKAG